MIKKGQESLFWAAQQHDFIDQKHYNMSIMNIYTAAIFDFSFYKFHNISLPLFYTQSYLCFSYLGHFGIYFYFSFLMQFEKFLFKRGCKTIKKKNKDKRYGFYSNGGAL